MSYDYFANIDDTGGMGDSEVYLCISDATTMTDISYSGLTIGTYGGTTDSNGYSKQQDKAVFHRVNANSFQATSASTTITIAVSCNLDDKSRTLLQYPSHSCCLHINITSLSLYHDA